MLERIVERSVAWAIDHAKLVIALVLALTVAAALYTARTLTMDTDTARMINAELPWKQQMAHINAAFPQNVGLLVVMVDGENRRHGGECGRRPVREDAGAHRPVRHRAACRRRAASSTSTA